MKNLERNAKRRRSGSFLETPQPPTQKKRPLYTSMPQTSPRLTLGQAPSTPHQSPPKTPKRQKNASRLILEQQPLSPPLPRRNSPAHTRAHTHAEKSTAKRKKRHARARGHFLSIPPLLSYSKTRRGPDHTLNPFLKPETRQKSSNPEQRSLPRRRPLPRNRSGLGQYTKHTCGTSKSRPSSPEKTSGACGCRLCCGLGSRVETLNSNLQPLALDVVAGLGGLWFLLLGLLGRSNPGEGSSRSLQFRV